VIMVLDERVAAKDRIIALAALLALALAALVSTFPLRGLRLLAQLLALTVALGLLRPRLPNGTSSSPARRGL